MEIPCDVTVIGGGPAGSTAALLLARSGFEVSLFEKRIFPREVLCGEFLSAEVIDHLHREGLFPDFQRLLPNPIRVLVLRPERGAPIRCELPFTAYGLRRGAFDTLLLTAAKQAGATIYQPAEVYGWTEHSGLFTVRFSQDGEERSIRSRMVIGAYGKQNILDKVLARDFARERSLLTGVKFHIDASVFPGLQRDTIHLFAGHKRYCGMNSVDGNVVTLSWLERGGRIGISATDQLKEMLGRAMFTQVRGPDPRPDIGHPHVHGAGNLWMGARDVVAHGVMMIGDAAGMIAPLAGDGIASAIEGAALVSDLLRRHFSEGCDVRETEARYQREWKRVFAERRRTAMMIQYMLLKEPLRTAGYVIARLFPSVVGRLLRETRRSGSVLRQPLRR